MHTCSAEGGEPGIRPCSALSISCPFYGRISAQQRMHWQKYKKYFMTRVTRGFVAKKRRKKVLKLASGFTGANNRLYRTAQQRTLRALSNAYRDRRLMKRTIRSIWIRRIHSFLTNYMITSINHYSSGVVSGSGVGFAPASVSVASVPPSNSGTPIGNRNNSELKSVAKNTLFTPSYSVFISKLKQSKILLNRKILSQLSIFDRHSMQKIIQSIE